MTAMATPRHRVSVAVAHAHAELDAVADSSVWSMTPEETTATLVEITRLKARAAELETRVAEHAEQIVAELRAAEPRAQFELTFTEQYRNMRYWLEQDMRPIEFAQEAIRRAGLTPKSTAIRGGTDGSNLTARGLPTPNLFCGMHEVHSPREWVSLQDMAKAVETLTHLAQVWHERSA